MADDERLMREQLRARLAEVWPELAIVAEAKNGLEAVELIDLHRPDLVFLDIRMPGMNGVEAARDAAAARTAHGCEIVFITAYDQYAIEAFEQGAVDYVLKPAERERLQLTVARVRQRIAQRAASPPSIDGAADAPMRQLLSKLAAHLDPGATRTTLRWIQASVGQRSG